MLDPLGLPAYSFRGRRVGAVCLWAFAAMFTALAVFGSAAAWRGGSLGPLLLAPIFSAVALLLGAMAARLPSAVVQPKASGLLVRFPVALDSIVPWSEVADAALVRHRLWQGLGIRLSLGGAVSLATLPGPCVEVTFRTPRVVTLLPGIARAHARALRLTVERPADLVADIRSQRETHRRS